MDAQLTEEERASLMNMIRHSTVLHQVLPLVLAASPTGSARAVSRRRARRKAPKFTTIPWNRLAELRHPGKSKQKAPDKEDLPHLARSSSFEEQSTQPPSVNSDSPPASDGVEGSEGPDLPVPANNSLLLAGLEVDNSPVHKPAHRLLEPGKVVGIEGGTTAQIILVDHENACYKVRTQSGSIARVEAHRAWPRLRGATEGLRPRRCRS